MPRETMKPSRIAWGRVIVSTLLISAIGAAAVALYFAYVTPTLPTAEVLTCIHRALEMYANESEAEWFPPTGTANNLFKLPTETLEKYVDTMPNGDLAVAFLRGECGVEVCYTGYLLPNPRTAIAFMDALATENTAFPETEVPCPVFAWDLGPPGPATTDYILRLRVGVERFLCRDIGNAAEPMAVCAKIPILWEMPDRREPAGGWVLYKDGHAEWLPYPGRFPMREFFIEWLRQHMTNQRQEASPSGSQYVSRPPSWWERGAEEPLRLPAVLKDCRPLWSLELTEVDTQPSIRLAGSMGYRVSAKEGYFVLFPEGQLFPADAKQEILRLFQISHPSGNLKPPCYLGAGHGWHWFAYTSAEVLEIRCLEWGLSGGDDRLQILIDEAALELMPRLGARAVPYLRSIVTQGTEAIRRPAIVYEGAHYESDFIAQALVSLGSIDDPSAAVALDAAFARDNPYAQRNAEALLNSAASGYFTSIYASLSISPDVQSRVAEVLSRDRTSEEIVRFAAEWVSMAHYGKCNFRQFEKMIMRMLERLPQNVYDRPLFEILGTDPPEHSGRLPFNNPYSWWDDIRQRATTAAQNAADPG